MSTETTWQAPEVTPITEVDGAAPAHARIRNAVISDV
jgi:hypothetical protein